MQLLLKDTPVLEIRDNGICDVLAYDLLPFGLRHETVTYAEFVEWASNRALSIGRSHAKEILNTLRLSQNNRFAVCIACRGLSLEDAYWIRQEDDPVSWAEINLFTHPLTLYVTEVSLSGQNIRFSPATEAGTTIHTPELTTLGVSAKAWIREEDGLYLHKIGKYEIPADLILEALQIPHIRYTRSEEQTVSPYLSKERRDWIDSVGEAMVRSALFTTEELSLVTFEEFEQYCLHNDRNPYEEARDINETRYAEMLLADYLLNNTDRHKQNWGFFMDNASGRLAGYCPLFDHDQSFSAYQNVMSLTTEKQMSLYDAAVLAQNHLQKDFSPLYAMEMPPFLNEAQWAAVLERARRL